jgi:hypothetical protein
MSRSLAPLLAILTIGTAAFDATPASPVVPSLPTLTADDSDSATEPIAAKLRADVLYTIDWNGYTITFWDDGMISFFIIGHGMIAIYNDGSMWVWDGDKLMWTPPSVELLAIILWMLFATGYVILP